MQTLYATPAWTYYLIVKICRTKGYCTKNGVEFRQGSVETIKSSLATSYDVERHRQFSTNQSPKHYLRHTYTQKSTYWQALLYKQRLQK